MKKLIAVAALSIASFGCSVAPQKMTTVDLCTEYGRAMAAGEVSRAISVEGVLSNRKDMNLSHCKMYAQKGVRDYHTGVALMQNGIQMMVDSSY